MIFTWAVSGSWSWSPDILAYIGPLHSLISRCFTKSSLSARVTLQLRHLMTAPGGKVSGTSLGLPRHFLFLWLPLQKSVACLKNASSFWKFFPQPKQRTCSLLETLRCLLSCFFNELLSANCLLQNSHL